MTYHVRPIDCVAPDEDPGDYYVINIVPQGPMMQNALLNLGLSREPTWRGVYYQSDVEFVFKELVTQIVACFDFNPSIFVEKLKAVPLYIYFEHLPVLASQRARDILKNISYHFALEVYAKICSITGMYEHYDVMLQSITIDNLTIYYGNKGAAHE